MEDDIVKLKGHLSRDPNNSHLNDIRIVRRIALWSRLLLFLLQVAANNLIPDHQPDVFNPPGNHISNSSSWENTIVQKLFGGFRRWDAIYFLFIAENGYSFENTLAFFPLYPLVVAQTAKVLQYLPLNLTFENWLLFSGFFLNLFFFVKSAESLFQWISLIENGRFRSTKFAAVIAFSFNPASIFFSASYSESLFSFLTFSAFKFLEKKNSFRTKIVAVGFIALSGATRSNGLVSLGLFGMKQLQNLWETLDLTNCKKKTATHLKNRLVRKPIDSTAASELFESKKFWSSTKIFFETGFLGIFGVFPFFVFQFYCFRLFCRQFLDESLPESVVEYAKERNYVYLHWSRPVSSWCNETIPFAYSHVQKNHWNVGFFQYYETKQIPNFLLALPILILSFWSLKKLLIPDFSDRKKGVVSSWTLIPYAIHLAFLLFFCLFFVHIQVTTRMICSSSPLIYLAVGQLFPNLRPTLEWRDFVRQIFHESRNRNQKLVIYYFFGYFVIGTVLHCNFLPWT